MYIKYVVIAYIYVVLLIGNTKESDLTIYVDVGSNVTLPCGLPETEEVTWVHARHDNQSNRFSIQSNRDLFLEKVEGNDTGTYSCRPVSEHDDKTKDTNQKIRLIVKTPPLPLSSVYVHASTILAVIFWNITGTGNSPIIHFTAEYKLASAPTEDEWILIAPYISPNSRQIDVYKLTPNTTYAFRIWAVNELGRSEITELLATTLKEHTEAEVAEYMLAGADTFDTRMWLLAVAVVMATLVVLALGMGLVSYQECRGLPGPGPGGGTAYGKKLRLGKHTLTNGCKLNNTHNSPIIDKEISYIKI